MVSPLLLAFIPYQHHDSNVALKCPTQVRRLQSQPQTFLPSTPRLQLAATTTDVELLPSIREAIQEEYSEDSETAKQTWEEAVNLVATRTGLSPDESELALAKAFGWRAWVKVTSTIARRFMKKSLPSLDSLAEALDWSLTSTVGPLQLSPAQLQTVLTTHPEVYLVDPAATYQTALSVAPEPYGGDSEKFRELAQQDPTVVACTFNCRDSGCSSECGNCWVSYDLKSKM
mmetsp:Transcript_18509/g.27974  ORF Transcript_18509/g.27974 Transcript_18509/m.27974 type:complete len:230 (+) Transcript_18509:71-760(+)